MHWDGVRALQQAGYKTYNKLSTRAQLRRLLEREDVKAVIDKAAQAKTPEELCEMDDKDRAVDACWRAIDAGGQGSGAFMTALTKLKGWDKGDQEDTEAQPPSFARMPFKPKEVSE
jgi:hypothetical protein